jgi:hypothetical protein
MAGQFTIGSGFYPNPDRTLKLFTIVSRFYPNQDKQPVYSGSTTPDCFSSESSEEDEEFPLEERNVAVEGEQFTAEDKLIVSVIFKEFLGLTSLNLSSNKLTEFPQGIKLLVNLKNLHLSCNKIKEIPEEIEFLTELEYLNLCINSLSGVIDLSKMKKLKTVILKSNQIEGVKLPLSVEKLELQNNKISKIDDNILKLVNLKELDLSYNQIELVPKKIADLKKLECFYLSNNKLKNITTCVCKLENLKFLSLKNNDIVALPAGLLKIYKLEISIELKKLDKKNFEMFKNAKQTENYCRFDLEWDSDEDF